MTSDEIAAVRARVEKATPGPWRAVIQPSWIPFVVLRERCAESSQLDTSMLHNEDDAQFIAHAREDVPNLLAALAAQTARADAQARENERLRTALAPVLAYLLKVDEVAGYQGNLKPGTPRSEKMAVVNDVWLLRSDILALAAAAGAGQEAGQHDVE